VKSENIVEREIDTETEYQDMKNMGGDKVKLYVFLNLTLDGNQLSALCSGRFIAIGKRHRY
jgi:hypothetical protein